MQDVVMDRVWEKLVRRKREIVDEQPEPDEDTKKILRRFGIGSESTDGGTDDSNQGNPNS